MMNHSYGDYGLLLLAIALVYLLVWFSKRPVVDNHCTGCDGRGWLYVDGHYQQCPVCGGSGARP